MGSKSCELNYVAKHKPDYESFISLGFKLLLEFNTLAYHPNDPNFPSKTPTQTNPVELKEITFLIRCLGDTTLFYYAKITNSFITPLTAPACGTVYSPVASKSYEITTCNIPKGISFKRSETNISFNFNHTLSQGRFKYSLEGLKCTIFVYRSVVFTTE